MPGTKMVIGELSWYNGKIEVHCFFIHLIEEIVLSSNLIKVVVLFCRR